MRTIILVLTTQAFLGAATYRIGMVNYAFVPQNQTVSSGDTVRWINQSISPHTSTSGTGGAPDSIWNSGTIASGDSFTFVFNIPSGDYNYYCAFHWGMGMTGMISVGTGIEESGDGQRAPEEMPALWCRPNPFIGPIRFDFFVPNPGETEIKLHDDTGRIVKTLVRGPLAAGRHSVQWEGVDDDQKPLPEGVYFVRLLNGSRNVIQKLILLK